MGTFDNIWKNKPRFLSWLQQAVEINEVEFHLNQNAFEDNTFGLRGLKTLRGRTGDGFLRARDKVEKENSEKNYQKEGYGIKTVRSCYRC